MSATDGGGGGGQEEDKKPADQSAHINLKVKGQVRLIINFAIINLSISLYIDSRNTNSVL